MKTSSFHDRFIRAHGFLYIVRRLPRGFMVFTDRKAVTVVNGKVGEVRKVIKRHALERLRG